MKPSTAHYPKQQLFVFKKKPRRRRRTCTREVEDPPTGLSYFQYGNGTELADDTEPADEPVDPASEQNHMGPPSQFLTITDSSGSVRPVSLKPDLSV